MPQHRAERCWWELCTAAVLHAAFMLRMRHPQDADPVPFASSKFIFSERREAACPGFQALVAQLALRRASRRHPDTRRTAGAEAMLPLLHGAKLSSQAASGLQCAPGTRRQQGLQQSLILSLSSQAPVEQGENTALAAENSGQSKLDPAGLGACPQSCSGLGWVQNTAGFLRAVGAKHQPRAAGGPGWHHRAVLAAPKRTEQRVQGAAVPCAGRSWRYRAALGGKHVISHQQHHPCFVA